MGCKFLNKYLVIGLLVLIPIMEATSTTNGRRRGVSQRIRKNQDDEEQQNLSMVRDIYDLHEFDDESSYDSGSSYWMEIKAIVGGVLGFWGGVAGLGAVFIVVVISQRNCCRGSRDDKDSGPG